MPCTPSTSSIGKILFRITQGTLFLWVDVMLDLPALPVKICAFIVFGHYRTLDTEFHSLYLLAKLEETTFWDCK